MRVSGRLAQAPPRKYLPRNCLRLACLLLAAAACPAQKPTPVPTLDLKAFTGTWYEVARLPYKPQKHCTGTPILLIALGDKPSQLQFVDSCTNTAGYTDVHNQSAKLANLKKNAGTADGKLKLATFLPLIGSPLWVLALDANAAIVGSPNHKKLWLLTRARTPDPAALAALQTRAAAEGYPVAKLLVAR